MRKESQTEGARVSKHMPSVGQERQASRPPSDDGFYDEKAKREKECHCQDTQRNIARCVFMHVRLRYRWGRVVCMGMRHVPVPLMRVAMRLRVMIGITIHRRMVVRERHGAVVRAESLVVEGPAVTTHSEGQ